MFRLTGVFLLIALSVSAAVAQGKGVDKSSERVRDSGSKAPASNGSKMTLGRRGCTLEGRTRRCHALSIDDYFPCDVILKAGEDVMRNEKLIIYYNIQASKDYREPAYLD